MNEVKPKLSDIFNTCLEESDRLLNLDLIDRNNTNTLLASVQPLLMSFFEPDINMPELELPDCHDLIKDLQAGIPMLQTSFAELEEEADKSHHFARH